MNSKDNNTSFWISYADLMAGLLFVFILLIGGIIVKYSLLEDQSHVLEKDLKLQKLNLQNAKKQLIEKDRQNKDISTELEKLRDDFDNAIIKFDAEKDKLEKAFLENEKLNLLIKEKNKLLEEQKIKLSDDGNKIKSFTLENKKLKLSLTNLEKSSVEKDEKIDSMIEDILVKKSLIDKFKVKTEQLNNEIKVLSLKLKNVKKEHDLLAKDLNSTKVKIKNLTGIKIKVISLLKSKLGKKIKINPIDGSLSLASNVLFDEGKYKLKDSAKKDLKQTVYDYFKTILDTPQINNYIDKIIIEGHTNTKGTFLYNLELSQKRAFSVMEFLLSLDFKNKDKLRSLVTASGRSYLDPIYDKNNVEDKIASRRIEIKFRLKNEEAIREIEQILK